VVLGIHGGSRCSYKPFLVLGYKKRTITYPIEQGLAWIFGLPTELFEDPSDEKLEDPLVLDEFRLRELLKWFELEPTLATLNLVPQIFTNPQEAVSFVRTDLVENHYREDFWLIYLQSQAEYDDAKGYNLIIPNLQSEEEQQLVRDLGGIVAHIGRLDDTYDPRDIVVPINSLTPMKLLLAVVRKLGGFSVDTGALL